MNKFKEQSVLKEVKTLLNTFKPENLKLKNLDQINVSFAFETKKETNFDVLSKMGYQKESNLELSVYSRRDSHSAFVSNVSVDKSKNSVTISVNY